MSLNLGISPKNASVGRDHVPSKATAKEGQSRPREALRRTWKMILYTGHGPVLRRLAHDACLEVSEERVVASQDIELHLVFFRESIGFQHIGQIGMGGGDPLVNADEDIARHDSLLGGEAFCADLRHAKAATELMVPLQLTRWNFFELHAESVPRLIGGPGGTRLGTSGRRSQPHAHLTRLTLSTHFHFDFFARLATDHGSFQIERSLDFQRIDAGDHIPFGNAGRLRGAVLLDRSSVNARRARFGGTFRNDAVPDVAGSFGAEQSSGHVHRFVDRDGKAMP